MSRSRATARQAGTKWETAIVGALVAYGWPHAERRRLAGSADKGDIAGIPGVVIEAKNTNRIELAAALDEANHEAINASAPIGAAWIKRKGKSDPLAGYVVMDGATFLRLLGEAGYQ
ncbi:MAG: hypothetical protein ACXVGA_03685 [Mycobacteriaceae bacterium]